MDTRRSRRRSALKLDTVAEVDLMMPTQGGRKSKRVSFSTDLTELREFRAAAATQVCMNSSSSESDTGLNEFLKEIKKNSEGDPPRDDVSIPSNFFLPITTKNQLAGGRLSDQTMYQQPLSDWTLNLEADNTMMFSANLKTSSTPQQLPTRTKNLSNQNDLHQKMSILKPSSPIEMEDEYVTKKIHEMASRLGDKTENAPVDMDITCMMASLHGTDAVLQSAREVTMMLTNNLEPSVNLADDDDDIMEITRAMPGNKVGKVKTQVKPKMSARLHVSTPSEDILTDVNMSISNNSEAKSVKKKTSANKRGVAAATQHSDSMMDMDQTSAVQLKQLSLQNNDMEMFEPTETIEIDRRALGGDMSALPAINDFSVLKPQATNNKDLSLITPYNPDKESLSTVKSEPKNTAQPDMEVTWCKSPSRLQDDDLSGETSDMSPVPLAPVLTGKSMGDAADASTLKWQSLQHRLRSVAPSLTAKSTVADKSSLSLGNDQDEDISVETSDMSPVPLAPVLTGRSMVDADASSGVMDQSAPDMLSQSIEDSTTHVAQQSMAAAKHSTSNRLSASHQQSGHNQSQPAHQSKSVQKATRHSKTARSSAGNKPSDTSRRSTDRSTRRSNTRSSSLLFTAEDELAIDARINQLQVDIKDYEERTKIAEQISYQKSLLAQVDIAVDILESKLSTAEKKRTDVMKTLKNKNNAARDMEALFSEYHLLEKCVTWRWEPQTEITDMVFKFDVGVEFPIGTLRLCVSVDSLNTMVVNKVYADMVEVLTGDMLPSYRYHTVKRALRLACIESRLHISKESLPLLLRRLSLLVEKANKLLTEIEKCMVKYDGGFFDFTSDSIQFKMRDIKKHCWCAVYHMTGYDLSSYPSQNMEFSCESVEGGHLPQCMLDVVSDLSSLPPGDDYIVRICETIAAAVP